MSITYLPGAVVILYREQPRLELLMIKRAAHLRAFPNAWAFPGGRRDSGDAVIAPAFQNLTLAAARQNALRECFEETGVLPGYQGKQGLSTFREALQQEQINWQECCQNLDYHPPLAEMTSLGLRVGPPIHLRPFEADYFLLKATETDPPLSASVESESVDWIVPAELLARFQQGLALVPPPVLSVLKVLAQVERIDRDSIAKLEALANSRERSYTDMEMHPGIEMLPLKTPTLAPATHTNCYLVGAKNFVIIDPASPYPDEQEKLKQKLQTRIDAGDRPIAVLLTHHHIDHVGAASFLQDWLQIPVMAHAEAACRLTDQIQINHELKDGDLIDLGKDPISGQAWQLEAIWTPGHAPGHLCFLDLRHRVSIVGDMLAGLGTILIQRPYGQMSQYLKSLARLRDLELKLALPAHGGLIQNPAAYCQYYIDHRLQREQSILDALATDSDLDIDALLSAVYPDIELSIRPLALESLQAHLDKLLAEARVILSKNETSARLVKIESPGACGQVKSI